MTQFERIIEAARNAGAEAREEHYTAGFYYDGQQHGEEFTCVHVSIDHMGDFLPIIRATESALKRFRGVTIDHRHTNTYTVYTVFRQADSVRMAHLERIAKTFLDAFWNEVHRQRVTGEPDDAQKAITAGHMAIERMEARTA